MYIVHWLYSVHLVTHVLHYNEVYAQISKNTEIFLKIYWKIFKNTLNLPYNKEKKTGPENLGNWLIVGLVNWGYTIHVNLKIVIDISRKWGFFIENGKKCVKMQNSDVYQKMTSDPPAA